MYNNEKSIDRDVLAGYNAGIERGRLHTGIGLIELARTKELLLEYLPKGTNWSTTSAAGTANTLGGSRRSAMKSTCSTLRKRTSAFPRSSPPNTPAQRCAPRRSATRGRSAARPKAPTRCF